MRRSTLASFVLGQPDLTTTTPPQGLRGPGKIITSKSLTFPNGVAYDRVRQQLYVSDQGNNRVLAFDVSVDDMRNHPAAISVYGQRDAVSTSDQVESDVSAQDQLYDTRGLAFDPLTRQLYVTDSHWARLMMFSAPDDSHDVTIAPDGLQRFSSLDPLMVLGPWPSRSGYGSLGTAPGLRGVYMTTRTRFDMDPLTEQQSRVLISQSAAPMRPLARRTLAFADGRAGSSSWISVVNPGPTPASVRVQLRDQDGTVASIRRVIDGGGSFVGELVELTGHRFETAAVAVDSDIAVGVSAWSTVTNRTGDTVETALPVVPEELAGRAAFLANAVLGGGYETDVVLLNAASESARGFVAVFDQRGREIDNRLYVIEPESAFVWQPPHGGLVPRAVYIRIRPTGSVQPALAAIVRRSDDGLITMTSTAISTEVERASIAVNTMPDLIRHGRQTSLQIVIVNPSAHGASIRMILRDLDGVEVDRVEQLIVPESQAGFTLGSLFDRTTFAGSLTLVSDVPVGVSARQMTVNVLGDEILTELPVLPLTGGRPVGPAVFPFTDGDGASTQIFVVSGDGQSVDTDLRFFDRAGDPLEVLLR